MWWEIVLLAIASLVVIIIVILGYGLMRWRASTKVMHKNLDATRVPIVPKTYDPKELEGLPPPVQNYFRTVLKDGQPMIAAVTVKHSGSFNMDEDGEQWRPFTSTQRVHTQRPGFDWEARIKMAPGLAVKVHDAYIAGEGILHASLFGLVTMAEIRGTPAAARGELMRYFAEMAWYPTRLLPSQGIYWEAVDDHSAQATLKDGDTELTMLFRFDENHLIESVYTKVRERIVGDEAVPTPWEGRLSHYELQDGMLIPLEGEVAWILPEGAKLYWRGRITQLNYEFAQ